MIEAGGGRRLGARRRLGRRLPSRAAAPPGRRQARLLSGLHRIDRRARAHAARRAGCSRGSTRRTATRRAAPIRRACRCTASSSACRITIRLATGPPAIGCITPIDAAAWRAASALLLTSPMTPLLFMGQEWAASSPFQYFTDLEPELGSARHRRAAARVRGLSGVHRSGGARAHPGSAGCGDVRAQQARLGRARAGRSTRTSLALYTDLLRLRHTHRRSVRREATLDRGDGHRRRDDRHAARSRRRAVHGRRPARRAPAPSSLAARRARQCPPVVLVHRRCTLRERSASDRRPGRRPADVNHLPAPRRGHTDVLNERNSSTPLPNA